MYSVLKHQHIFIEVQNYMITFHTAWFLLVAFLVHLYSKV